MDLIETQIFCEDINDTLTLNLTQEQVDRASIDTLYLRDLVNRHLVERAPALETFENATETIEAATAMDTTQDTNNIEDNSLFLWKTQCVLLLLNIYEERREDFNDGSKRHKKIWEEIANKMNQVNENYNVTGLQCQSKMSSLKRTYKKILDHNSKSGNDRASWPFFDRMHEIFSATGWAKPISIASSDHTISIESTKSTKQTQESPKPNNQLEKYFRQLKEGKHARAKEREERKKERFTKFLEIKERHHNEKMKLLEQLLKK